MITGTIKNGRFDSTELANARNAVMTSFEKGWVEAIDKFNLKKFGTTDEFEMPALAGMRTIEEEFDVYKNYREMGFNKIETQTHKYYESPVGIIIESKTSNEIGVELK